MTVPHGEDRGSLSLRVLTAGERQRADDLEWAASAPEVRQHLGQFVVVHRRRVVAVGTDRPALVEQAAAQEQCPWWELAVVAVPAAELWENPE
jgi:hypothetical protein